MRAPRSRPGSKTPEPDRGQGSVFPRGHHAFAAGADLPPDRAKHGASVVLRRRGRRSWRGPREAHPPAAAKLERHDAVIEKRHDALAHALAVPETTLAKTNGVDAESSGGRCNRLECRERDRRTPDRRACRRAFGHRERRAARSIHRRHRTYGWRDRCPDSIPIFVRFVSGSRPGRTVSGQIAPGGTASSSWVRPRDRRRVPRRRCSGVRR